MAATPEQIAWLQRVQDHINAVPYEALGTDAAEDNWITAPEPGKVYECRDYTIAKLKLLREQGWPVADLSVVLCNTELGDWHAVACVKAGGDLYILDNRALVIYLWTEPPYPYKWLSQQLPNTDYFRDASGGLV